MPRHTAVPERERTPQVNYEKPEKIFSRLRQITDERGKTNEERAGDILNLMVQSRNIASYERPTLKEDRYEQTDWWVCLHDGQRLRLQVKSSALGVMNALDRVDGRPDLYYLIVNERSDQEIIRDFLERVLMRNAMGKIRAVLQQLSQESLIHSCTEVRFGQGNVNNAFRFHLGSRLAVIALQHRELPVQGPTRADIAYDIVDISHASVDQILHALRGYALQIFTDRR